VESRNETRVEAAERFSAARQDRDRRADEHDAARGSAGELPALSELLAAEDKLAAREAWLKWTERVY
jgi:hypothetical protein